MTRLTLARNRYAAAHDRFALAFDRGSVRRKSPDGHLHVASSIVSSACVNDYLAEEIPNFRLLGLQPGRTYALLRDPVALEKAVPSLNGKPLVIRHREQTAGEHDRDIVVGSVGNPTWVYPNVLAEIVVWDGAAISLIESGEQADFSAGYFYQPMMDRGSFNGVRYDGRMINIVFNHLALVDAGRVVGAVVGDSAIKKGVMKMANANAKKALEALTGHLQENMGDQEFQHSQDLINELMRCCSQNDDGSQGDDDPDSDAMDDPEAFKGMPRTGADPDYSTMLKRNGQASLPNRANKGAMDARNRRPADSRAVDSFNAMYGNPAPMRRV